MLIGVGRRRRRLRIPIYRTGRLVADVRRVRVGFAGRRRATIGDRRQAGTAAKWRPGRVCKSRNGILSGRERRWVKRLRRLLVGFGILARRSSKRRGETAARLLLVSRRRVLTRTGTRDDF
jgi:hypothetical protein